MGVEHYWKETQTKLRGNHHEILLTNKTKENNRNSHFCLWRKARATDSYRIKINLMLKYGTIEKNKDGVFSVKNSLNIYIERPKS